MSDKTTIPRYATVEQLEMVITRFNELCEEFHALSQATHEAVMNLAQVGEIHEKRLDAIEASAASTRSRYSHDFEEVGKEFKRVRFDISHHVENLIRRLDKLETASKLAGAADKLIMATLVDNNLTPSRLTPEAMQDDKARSDSAERSRDSAVAETNEPARNLGAGIDSTNFYAVVQAWIDSCPAYFRKSNDYVPIPVGFESRLIGGFSTLELILIGTAERLRRLRMAGGSRIESYPRIQTKRPDARKGTD